MKKYVIVLLEMWQRISERNRIYQTLPLSIGTILLAGAISKLLLQKLTGTAQL
jgi:hypothetical protein